MRSEAGEQLEDLGAVSVQIMFNVVTSLVSSIKGGSPPPPPMSVGGNHPSVAPMNGARLLKGTLEGPVGAACMCSRVTCVGSSVPSGGFN